MELIIYFFVTVLVLVAADFNPQTTASSSLTSVPRFGDRLKTPELTLYLTRDVVKALQDVKLPKKSVSSIKTHEQNSHTSEEKYSPKNYGPRPQQEKSLKKNRGFVSRFFLPRNKDVIENQEKNDLSKFYLESLKIQKHIYENLQKSQQNIASNEESQMQTNANFLPFIPYTNQEEILPQDQPMPQWSHILDQNRGGSSYSRQKNEENNQKPPILIHSELRITKHHPVAVYSLV